MKFTNILYDINKKEIGKNSISKNSTFYFYSYQIISVEIVSGTAFLYSVKNIAGTLQTQVNQTFTDNFGYTLYIPNNNNTICLKITNSQNIENYYYITSKYDNIIDETNEHYIDLLVNYNLPSFEQLKASIPDDFDESEILKRLLLEFRNILKYKGSKKSIEQFLNFIGFADKNLVINDLYKNKDGDLILIPNKKIDIKTGKYSVLYDNYNELGYNENNLPIREFNIQNIDNFKESLINAIVLANTYFTAEEQEIVFFGLNYSSNIALEPNLTSNMSAIFENDVYGFTKELDIDIYSFLTKTSKKIFVKNTLQKNDKTFLSEVKTIRTTPKNNNEIYFIDSEVYDSDIQIDFENYEEVFGVILNLDIFTKNSFIKFTVECENNPLSILIYNKEFISEELKKIIVLTKTGNYTITIWITDIYNNTEKYFYNINVDIDSARIDFDLFNSSELIEKNSLTLDIDSDTEISLPSTQDKKYILPLSSVPLDLSTYYNYYSGFSKFLKNVDEYILPEINKNNAVNDLTETIPTELIDNFLEIVSFKYYENYTLKIRVYDIELCEYVIVELPELKNYHKEFDILYCVIMDIFDRNPDNTIQTTKTPYYFITTTEGGVNFDETSFDFVLVNESNQNDIISIYELDIVKRKIGINYDFQLFPILSELVPTFIPYISDAEYKTKLGDTFEEYVTVKSLFTRLQNISETLIDTYKLKLDDVFVCKLNENYVVGFTDIVWKVYNTFTNELLFETNDLTLKYRVEENICYDVSCDILINNKQYQIYKKSVFSSFEINL